MEPLPTCASHLPPSTRLPSAACCRGRYFAAKVMGEAIPCLQRGSAHWAAMGARMKPRICDWRTGLAATEAAIRPDRDREREVLYSKGENGVREGQCAARAIADLTTEFADTGVGGERGTTGGHLGRRRYTVMLQRLEAWFVHTFMYRSHRWD